MVWSGLIAAALVVAPEASPREAGTLGVTPLIVSGELPASLEGDARDRELAGARRGPFKVIEIDAGGDCETAACFADVARRHSADYLLVGRLQVSDGQRSYRFDLRILDAKGGELFAGEARCDVCGFAEAADRLEDRVASAANLIDRPELRRAEVVIDGSPAGATVWIDGAVAGQIPHTQDVIPGKHRIRVAKEGYLSEDLEVDLPAGGRKALELRLRPDPAIEEERRAARRSRAMVISGSSILGISVGAFIGGGVLLGIHRRPYRRDCQGDVEGNCRFLYGTQPAGIAVIVVGGVGLITGIALLIAGKRRQSKRSTQSFFVSPPSRASTKATRSRALARPSFAAER